MKLLKKMNTLKVGYLKRNQKQRQIYNKVDNIHFHKQYYAENYKTIQKHRY